MIIIKNALTAAGTRHDFQIQSDEQRSIDADRCLALPGLIDPHVHFRTPGQEHKEDWRTASRAAIAGGYTMVMDMPNVIPATVTAMRLVDKKAIIDQQLTEAGIPLRYHLYFGADKLHFDQLHLVKDQVIGVKVFMGSSTGDLLMDDDSSLHALFALAGRLDLLVAIHAEDECGIQERRKLFPEADFNNHSRIRSPEVAAKAVAKVIELSRLYKVRVYILHMSTSQELELIRAAKTEGLPIYAECCPHHLFLDDTAYARMQGRAQMNPPLRDRSQCMALWKGISDGTIDTIGSDHAPHTVAEKSQGYGKCPSGVPGIQTTLPLLLNAHHHGLLSLPKLVQLTSSNAQKIFKLPVNQDLVLVDLNLQRVVEDAAMYSKCGWSPYAGMKLKGWPLYTIVQGKVFDLAKL